MKIAVPSRRTARIAPLARRVPSSLTLLLALSAALVFSVVLVAQSAPQPPSQAPSPAKPDAAAPAPPASTPAMPAAAVNTSASADPAQRRKDQIASDSARLFELANELKAEMDKSTKDTLSLSVIKKAEEVEKLAHKVRDEMRSSLAD